MSGDPNRDLREYAAQLPEIYREILSAFPRLEPSRQVGFGLAYQSIAADFEQQDRGFGLDQIIAASGQLQSAGLVEIKHRMFVHPTEYGERLITTITGHHPSSPEIPPLPPPPPPSS